MNKREAKEEAKLERKWHKFINSLELKISDYEGRIHEAKKFFNYSNFDHPTEIKRSKFPEPTVNLKLSELLEGDQ